MSTPRNIFEQILFGQQTTNENILALADNLKDVYDKLNALIDTFSTTPISAPTDSGIEGDIDKK